LLFSKNELTIGNSENVLTRVPVEKKPEANK